MCRYAWHNYRDHFACFECRKAFKYWQWEDCRESEWDTKSKLRHVPREIVCPDCHQPMVDMGLDFKAPSRSDAEAWQILKLLQENGYTFHGCGCYVGFKPPTKLRDVAEWLAQHHKPSEAERVLERYATRK